jgi:hypothetical protein
MGACKQYYEQMAALIPNPAVEHVLKYGKEFDKVDVALSLKMRKQHGCQNNQCYCNCQLLAVYDERWIYFEGVALSQSLPIPLSHAWVVDGASGILVDPTWCRKKDPITGADYFGVCIPSDFIQKQWVKTKTYCEMMPTYLMGVIHGKV